MHKYLRWLPVAILVIAMVALVPSVVRTKSTPVSTPSTAALGGKPTLGVDQNRSDMIVETVSSSNDIDPVTHKARVLYEHISHVKPHQPFTHLVGSRGAPGPAGTPLLYSSTRYTDWWCFPLVRCFYHVIYTQQLSAIYGYGVVKMLGEAQYLSGETFPYKTHLNPGGLEQYYGSCLDIFNGHSCYTYRDSWSYFVINPFDTQAYDGHFCAHQIVLATGNWWDNIQDEANRSGSCSDASIGT